MPNHPTERLFVKNAEGDNIPLVSVWKQTKGQLTGKIKVTDELAALFRPGAELYVVSFPTAVFPIRSKGESKNVDHAPDVA